MNIMLIDDDDDCLVGLASAIEPAGHHCATFSAPEEAVAAFQSASYDCVLTDMKMPRMNGIQVLKAIKAHHPDARVIIITGYGDVETAIAAVNNGAYAFFGKPVDINELLQTLDKITHETEVKQQTKEQLEQLAREYARLKKAYEELTSLLHHHPTQQGRVGKNEP